MLLEGIFEDLAIVWFVVCITNVWIQMNIGHSPDVLRTEHKRQTCKH